MSAAAVGGGPTVVVVGGGIAGLAGAWELTTQAPAARVVLLEAAPRLGGKIDTADIGGRPVDLGPDAFVARRPEAVELCVELGLGPELVAPGANTASLWSGGRLRQLPPGLALGVPTRVGPLARTGILSAGGIGRVAADLLTPPWAEGDVEGDDEAIGPLLTRRLGREVVDRLADPLIGGIHAGTVDILSAAAVFPALLDAARRPGSLLRNLRATMPAPSTSPSSGTPPVFLTVRGGLGRLVDALTGALRGRGAELHTGRAVTGMTRAGGRWRVATADGSTLEADAVLLAVPAMAAAPVVREAAPGLAELLGGLRYSSVALVTMRFPPAAVGRPPVGTGYLVDRSAGALLTACTWMSVKWPDLARPGDVLVRVSAGRFGDDRAGELDDGELVKRALLELTPAMGLVGVPLDTRVARYAGAFPQYEVGHLHRVEAMERAARRAGRLAVAGAALRGVGIPACIDSGRRAAAALLAELPATTAT